MKRRVALTLSILTLVVAALIGATGRSSAAGSTLSLSPSTVSHNNGDTFSVSVIESGGSASVVQAFLTYNPTQLQYVSDSCGGSFSSTASTSGGGGNIELSCFVPAGGTATGTVGTITLKALVGGNTPATVAFAGNSIIYVGGGNDYSSGSSGTYTLTTPATPTCPAGQTGTYPNCTTPPPPPPPSGGTTTPPKTTTTKTTPTTVSSSDTSGQQANPATPVEVSKTDTSSTGAPAAYLVTVKVVNSKGKPESGVQVTLGTFKAKTDSSGIASFSNVTPGTYSVKVSSGSVLGDSTISVDGNQPSNAVQQFEVKTKASSKLLPYLILAGLVVIMVIIIGLLRAGKMKGLKTQHSTDGPSAVVGGSQVKSAADTKGKDDIIKPTVISPGTTSKP